MAPIPSEDKLHQRTLNGLVQSTVRLGWDALFTYRYFGLFATAYLSVQAALLALIVIKVPYTEIDFGTYLEQAGRYLEGERDYTQIDGRSGPCVYPAAHLYLHAALVQILNYAPLAKSGWLERVVSQIPLNDNVLARFESDKLSQVLAQGVFALLALATSVIILDLYRLTSNAVAQRLGTSEGHSSDPQLGWRSKVQCISDLGICPAAPIPPILLLWPLASKRLHSIYVLRMFNDPWALGIFYLALWSLIRFRATSTACVLFSLAVGIKMNVLLFLPAWGVALEQLYGIAALVPASSIVFVQCVLAYPFASQYPAQYWFTAFDFGRQFEYQWTVNWRVIPESVFLSSTWPKVLLLAHASLLTAFILSRWTPISRIGLANWVHNDLLRSPTITHAPAADFIFVTLATANLIGITASRSLHYQFFSWYAHQLPLLLTASRLPVWIKVALPFAITVGWDTFPSTGWSSSVLLLAHALLLLGLWRSSWSRVPVTTP